MAALVPTFHLPDYLAEALAQEDPPLRLVHGLNVPSSLITDWSGVPSDAEVLTIDSSLVPNLGQISRFPKLRVVICGRPTEEFFEGIRDLPQLEAMELRWVLRPAELRRFDGTRIRHLMLSVARRPLDLSILEAFPNLRTLHFDGCSRVDPDAMPELPELRGLYVGRGVFSCLKLPSLRFVEKFPKLRIFLGLVEPEDRSLRPLSKLKNLQIISLANVHATEEVARLAGSLPQLAEGQLPPIFGETGSHYAQCRKCGGVSSIGWSAKALKICPVCYPDKLSAYLTTWETEKKAGWSS
ncbi:MAG TPA: hypothetical protein VGD88_06935 [Opitutaceae bacterium]